MRSVIVAKRAPDRMHGRPDAAQPKVRTLLRALGDPADKEFDRLIYERIRLGILSALAMNETLSFSEFKALFKASDGNLSAHARKLEDAGYVACTKTFAHRRPKTVYRLTRKGRRAFDQYLSHMEAVIRATRSTE